tara:strand:+ start:2827 stop:3018 length:192 start_codon:yes stop_codon:yes gene_type:complete
MKVRPIHSANENCYRVYILSKGLRQQVGSDFTYNEENQEKKWIDCLSYAKEIEEQLEYYKDKN